MASSWRRWGNNKSGDRNQYESEEEDHGDTFENVHSEELYMKMRALGKSWSSMMSQIFHMHDNGVDPVCRMYDKMVEFVTNQQRNAKLQETDLMIPSRNHGQAEDPEMVKMFLLHTELPSAVTANGRRRNGPQIDTGKRKRGGKEDSRQRVTAKMKGLTKPLKELFWPDRLPDFADIQGRVDYSMSRTTMNEAGRNTSDVNIHMCENVQSYNRTHANRRKRNHVARSRRNSRGGPDQKGPKPFGVCNSVGAVHGIKVHAQINRLVKWMSDSNCSDLTGFLDKYPNEPLDSCTIRILCWMESESMVPLFTEHRIYDELMAIFTPIDIIGVSPRGICTFIELKTGYVKGPFSGSVDDDRYMEGCFPGGVRIRDTPLNRAAMQMMMQTMMTIQRYGYCPDRMVVLHVDSSLALPGAYVITEAPDTAWWCNQEPIRAYIYERFLEKVDDQHRKRVLNGMPISQFHYEEQPTIIDQYQAWKNLEAEKAEKKKRRVKEKAIELADEADTLSDGDNANYEQDAEAEYENDEEYSGEESLEEEDEEIYEEEDEEDDPGSGDDNEIPEIPVI